MSRTVQMPIHPASNQIEAALPHLPDMTPDKARRVLRAIYETFIDMRPEAQQPIGMTQKMAQLLEVICEYTDEHGYSPTQLELSEMFGVDRKAISRRIDALRARGYLVKRRAHRGIVIVKRL